MLSVEHVTKKYGQFTALEDISLTFTPGVYGLLAPNGAGKTTLIKMLTTLLFPTRGQILWDGEDIQALAAQLEQLDLQVSITEGHGCSLPGAAGVSPPAVWVLPQLHAPSVSPLCRRSAVPPPAGGGRPH